MKIVISLFATCILAVMSSFAQIRFSCDEIQKATDQFNKSIKQQKMGYSGFEVISTQ